MVVEEILFTIIFIVVIYKVFVNFPMLLLKKCCSFNSLLYSIIIQSIVGLIVNSLFVLLQKNYIFKESFEFISIFIEISYLVSIISSIILLYKSVKLKKNNIPLTRMKCVIIIIVYPYLFFSFWLPYFLFFILL